MNENTTVIQDELTDEQREMLEGIELVVDPKAGPDEVHMLSSLHNAAKMIQDGAAALVSKEPPHNVVGRAIFASGKVGEVNLWSGDLTPDDVLVKVDISSTLADQDDDEGGPLLEDDEATCVQCGELEGTNMGCESCRAVYEAMLPAKGSEEARRIATEMFGVAFNEMLTCGQKEDGTIGREHLVFVAEIVAKASGCIDGALATAGARQDLRAALFAHHMRKGFDSITQRPKGSTCAMRQPMPSKARPKRRKRRRSRR